MCYHRKVDTAESKTGLSNCFSLTVIKHGLKISWIKRILQYQVYISPKLVTSVFKHHAYKHTQQTVSNYNLLEKLQLFPVSIL